MTQIIGNVGRDVDFKYTQSGVPIATFSVATTKKFTIKDSKETREETTWIRCTAWRQLAEIVNSYVKKGMSVYVQGEMKSSAYLDKAGKPQSSLELTADVVQMLDRKDSSGAAAADGFQEPAPDKMADIPF